MMNSTGDQQHCEDDNSSAEQIAYAVSQLDDHEDQSVLDWDLEIRQKLYQEGGFATILLSKKPTHKDAESDGTPSSYESPRPSTSTETSDKSPCPTIEVGTNVQDLDPEDYYTFKAPKLGLLVVSPVLCSLFETYPQATQVLLPNPYGALKPVAIKKLATWLDQLLQSDEPRPIDSLADRKSLSNLNEALDIRVAMQLLGMEDLYLTHFVPLYTASLSQRKPTILEAKAVVSHVVPEICPRGEDDAVVQALAERVVEVQRKNSLDARMWEAYLQKGSNRGLLAAVRKYENVFVGVRSVITPRRSEEVEYPDDIYAVHAIVNGAQERVGPQEQVQDGNEEVGERLEKKASKGLKSRVSSKLSAGLGKVRRIASGGSRGHSKERKGSQ